MPFLGRLASLLVAGDEQAQVVGFQMGGLVKLEPKVDRDGFSVAWALPPDHAQKLDGAMHHGGRCRDDGNESE